MMSNNARKFSLNFNHKILGGEARLWVPVALKAPYQRVDGEYGVNSNADEARIFNEPVDCYYAKFSGRGEAKFRLNFGVEISERNTDFSRVNFNENEKLEPQIAEFLKPSKLIPVSGAVKQIADEVAGGVKGDLEKARAIYLWTAKNMRRDNAVDACGTGDAGAILASGDLRGKCADINSVFVALCRASGIAARAIYGIRVGRALKFSPEMGVMGEDKDGALEILGAQHCRAEFYLKGYGWIPVDPADVTKVRLGENLSEDDPKLARAREYLFGNWEPCWLGFNFAREVTLNPPSSRGALEIFSHPYCEAAAGVKFSYEYFSREI